MQNHSKSVNFNKEFWLSLTFAVLATIFLEHSQIDVMISQQFYLGNAQWLISKDNPWFTLIFYDFPKKTLIVFELIVILAWLQRTIQSKNSKYWFAKKPWFRWFSSFSQKELSYLAITMLLVPTVVATLKGITHVSCPNHLTLFGGQMPYVSVWQSIQLGTSAKCFPAAHASSGFALYALAFVATLQNHRWKIACLVTMLAWAMGGYKMAIGDHFFSHTLVAMLLAWTISAGMAWRWFAYR